ncbi:MAG TPA: HAD family hydrolase [Nitrospirae bacterium]|nr:phosphoglycolate phosphatase [bacterium BMS3Abin10]GBE39899.1 phosphoglycolate phosphatase [bacterium BMS3Bbin08]HDH00479.1 HAD family hydrolase [Nitrospirota bacterium]HDH50447.1 HAD family hydrolase [Nitrospirota bacterium]HDO25555.1 HAD family hydrolase [Nitrospirota bacterium]
MIKILIFDLDGTLIDSAEDIANAVNHAIVPAGMAPLSTEKIVSMVGHGIKTLIGGLVPPEHYEGSLKRFLEHYSEHILDNTKPYPKVKETLSKLGNYKKAVISNKRETLSKDVMNGLGLTGFFDVILGADSVSERKPSPAPVLEVLKRVGIPKESAVIIGDSDVDVQTGKAAGIKTIAVTYGYRSKEVLKEADRMIDSFDELLSVLKEID